MNQTTLVFQPAHKLYKTPHERSFYAQQARAKKIRQEQMSQIQEVLVMLMEAHWQEVEVFRLVYELRCHRFGAYIYDLRKMWYNIETIDKWIDPKTRRKHTAYVLHDTNL